MKIARITAAHERIRGLVRHTPLLSSPFLDRIAGRRVLVKAEALQHTGSFKFRGASAALTALDAETRRRGVLAYSSGNHAQGVAAAAAAHDVPAVIVMPRDAPRLKIDNTRDLGAEVVLYDRAGGESRETIGAELAERRNLTLIRPYDEPEVIAGQGSVGLELAEDLPAGLEADVLVCCGGGGLTSGMALALEARAPGLRVRPVEPDGFDDVARSLVSGQRQVADRGRASICDAIVTPSPGELTFPVMRRLCGPGLVVTDDEALDAVAQAAKRLKLVLEPGGAVALAAALARRDEIRGDTVVVVATGGNADPATLSRALDRL